MKTLRFKSAWICGAFIALTAAVRADIEVRVSGPAGASARTLPDTGGVFDTALPLNRNAVNEITVTASDPQGRSASASLSVTQVSLDQIVVSRVTTERLSTEEIEQLVADGRLNLDNPDNFNVSTFVLVLTVAGREVPVSVPIAFAVNDPEPSGEERIPFPWGDGSGGGANPQPQPEIIFFAVESSPPAPGQPKPPPIPGVLVIEGRIRSLKEFFAARLLLLNTSGIFTLSGVMAEIRFPDGGLTCMLPEDGAVSFGDILPGNGGEPGQAEREFILRGDLIGTRGVEVGFAGTVTGPGIAPAAAIPFSGSARGEVEVKGPPSFTVRVQHPPLVTAGVPYDLTVEITNTGDLPARYASLELDVSADAQLARCTVVPVTGTLDCDYVRSPEIRSLGHIQPGASVMEVYTVLPDRSGVISSCTGASDQNITLQVYVGTRGCAVGSFPPAAGGADGIPAVLVVPANNTAGVSTEAPVFALFSENMRQDSITTGPGGSFNVFDPAGVIVPGVLRMETNTTGRLIAIWQVNDGLTNRLRGGTTYSVRLLSSVRDLEGNGLASDWLGTFRTTGAGADDHDAPTLALSIAPPVDPAYVLPGERVVVEAYAEDQGSGVERVELRIRELGPTNELYRLVDQKSVFAGDLPPYLFVIDSARLDPGKTYQLHGTAFDANGNARQSTLAFNLAATAAPPVVVLPADPALPVLQGITVNLKPEQVSAGVRFVRYYLDGASEPFKTVTLPPWQGGLSTLTLAWTSHTVRVVAEDGLGQTGEDSFGFNLIENANAPRVSFNLADGEVFRPGDPVVVDPRVEDDVGVADLRVYLDSTSTLLATNAGPVRIDTAGLPTGLHEVLVVASNLLGVGTDPLDPSTRLEFLVLEAPNGPPPPVPVVLTVRPPDASEVEVLGTAPAGARVNVLNVNTGASSQTTADGAGGFTARISGSGGDTLRLVCYDFTVSQQPSAPAEVVVPEPPVLTGIRITPETITLGAVGAFADLTVLGAYSDGSESDVTALALLTSGAPEVVSVDSSGRVVAHRGGAAVITARMEGFTATRTVSCSIVTLVSLQVTPSSLVFPASGGSVVLEVRGMYDDGSTAPLTSGNGFASGNSLVASVDSAGRVTAVAAGETAVTVSRPGVPPVSVPVRVGAGAVPVAVIIEPGRDAAFGYGDTIPVTIQLSDPGGLNRVRCHTAGSFVFDETRNFSPAVVSTTVVFQVSVPFGAADPELRLHAEAWDGDGNRGEAIPVPVLITDADRVPPSTFVASVSDPGSGPSASLTVQILDGLADIDHVEIYFRRNGHGRFNRYTNAPGGNPTGEHNAPAATVLVPFDSTRMGGDGTYEFFSVGVDAAGNREPAPVPADAIRVFADGTVWTTIAAATNIGPGDTTYDDRNVRIDGVQVVVEGAHSFRNVELLNGAVLTHPEATASAWYGLDVTAWTLLVDSTSLVNANARGYLGGERPGNPATYGLTVGNTAGSTPRSGGSHGGTGGVYSGAPCALYGNLTAPADPGSGGSRGSNAAWSGGDGGGLITLRAVNIVNDGVISANGGDGSGDGAGGGSGGGIHLIVSSIGGAGAVAASGGGSQVGGGGGRIAIHYADAQYLDVSRVSALGGSGSWGSPGGNGTAFLRSLAETGGTLVVDGQGVVSTYSALPIPPGHVFDNIVVRNSARVIANDPIEVADRVQILSGSIVTHATGLAGGLVIRGRRLEIDATSAIHVSGRGYQGGERDGNAQSYGITLNGQNGSTSRAGGSYGGLGAATGSGVANSVYGHPAEPVHLGSGGSRGSNAAWAGGNGGGRVDITLSQSLLVDGVIRADGQDGAGDGAGGGSGGAIRIDTSLIRGTGAISAQGGGTQVGGGGGRIRIAYDYFGPAGDDLSATRSITAYGGAGSWSGPGAAGTVLLRRHDQTHGDLLVDAGVSGATATAQTHPSLIGFGTVASRTADTLVTDGSVSYLPGALAGLSVQPNRYHPSVFNVISNTRTSLVVDVSSGVLLTDVCQPGDDYAGVYRFDTVRFRRGGYLCMGDILTVGGTVDIDEYGCLTHFDATTTFVSGLDLTASELLVRSSGTIRVDARGYLGGERPGNPDTKGRTLGNLPGSAPRSGGSHGGLGGAYDGAAGSDYGDLMQPGDLGSGGSRGSNSAWPGGDGGGRIRLTADSLRVDGVISANGQDGSGDGSGGGSGGAIFITAGVLAGNGQIQAIGGGSQVSGGGGRIALHAETSTFDTNRVFATSPMGSWGATGGNGTLFTKRPSQPRGDLIIDGHDSVTPLDRCFIPAGLVFKDILLRNRASVNADASVTATGALALQNRSVLTHTLSLETGLQIDTGSLSIDATSAVDVSARGYRGGERNGNSQSYGITLDGQVGAQSRAGGSFGGGGGVHSGTGGNPVYGHPANPVYLGSGGSRGSNSAWFGGNGGGRVDLRASGQVRVDGAIRSNGQDGHGDGAGGGSGGSIRIDAASIAGAGSITANGGGTEVGGGGGRISLMYDSFGPAGSDFDATRTITAFGGAGSWGAPGASGTVLLRPRSQTLGDLILDAGRTGVTAEKWTEITRIGFGTVQTLLPDRLRTDGTVAYLPGALAGLRINPNLGQAADFLIVDNTVDTIVVDISGGVALTDVAAVGDRYAASYVFDNVLLRRGGFAAVGDRLRVPGQLRVTGSGRLSHFDATGTSVSRMEVAAGRVWVDATSSIHVDGRGYLGGERPGNPAAYGLTSGNTAGSTPRSGGSYGGLGAVHSGGVPNPLYGDPAHPAALGSGGSRGSNAAWSGGDGGGWIRLLAGELQVDGVITASGLPGEGDGAGGGSGGSIYIETGALTGSGAIRANGGGTQVAGGGGRIAFYYSGGSSDLHLLAVTTAPGTGSWAAASAGSVHSDPAYVWSGLPLVFPALPPGSFFRPAPAIRSFARQGEELLLTFAAPAAKSSTAATAKTYIIEFTPDLLHPDWREVPGVFEGNDWRGMATGLQGFYRIRETP